MCGLPFSGKTTLARALADQYDCVHLDLDSLANLNGFSPEEGIDDKQWSLLFSEAHQHLAALLSLGKSVVFDAVNCDRVGRDRLRAVAQQNGSAVYVIYTKLTIQELAQRRHANRNNRQRPNVRDKDFVELLRDFEVPTAKENLIVYDGAQPIAEWIHGHIPRTMKR
jgi:predicted kinase